MNPRDPDSGVESDLAAGPPASTRERGLAPASTLMSVQIRRRTLSRVKPRQDKPAQDKPAQDKPPLPKSPAPPAAVLSASDPGRRLQGVVPSPSAPPSSPPAAAPPTAPPAAVPPAAAPPSATPPAPSPAPPAPAARAPLTSPGITRHARTGAAGNIPGGKPALAIPATKPAAPKSPPPPDTAPAPPTPPAQATRPEGIVSYWLRLRGSRRFPSKADLDEGRIVTDWPNSILMRCRVGSKAMEPEKVFSSPNAAPGDTAQAAMDLSPMMLQWLLALAGDAAEDRRPMQDTEAFPSRNQSVRYGAFALPFSDDQAEIDHVLCHVYRIL